MPTNEFGVYIPTKEGNDTYIGPFTDAGYENVVYNPRQVRFYGLAEVASMSLSTESSATEEGGPTPLASLSNPIVLGDGSLAALRAELMACDVPVPTEIQTTEMLAAEVRAERDSRLFEYDAYIAYLQRELRKTNDAQRIADINATIEVLDAWAIELCNLPQQAGFPWQGLVDAPFPAYPPVLKITTVEIEKKK